MTEETNQYVKDMSTQKQIKKFLFDAYKSEIKTNAFRDSKNNPKEQEELIQAIKELREENIFFLLRSCGYVIENEKYKINSKLKPGTIEYTKEKNKIDNLKIQKGIDSIGVVYITHEIILNKGTKNEIKYIAIESIYKESKTINNAIKREFKIYKNIDKNGNEINIEDLKKSDNPEENKKRLETIKSLQKVDEQDIEHIIESMSSDLIEKEKEFQLKRLSRLNSFIDNLFKDNDNLIKQIKDELKNCITVIFNNNSNLEEKFKATQKLASLLKLIKTSYKQDKKLTNHFLMLSNICKIANTKTFEESKEEFQTELNYLYEVGTARTYHKERCKEIIPSIYNNNIAFRGISMDTEIFTEDFFKKLDPKNINILEFFYGITDKNVQIGFTNTVGNITSYTTDASVPFI